MGINGSKAPGGTADLNGSFQIALPSNAPSVKWALVRRFTVAVPILLACLALGSPVNAEVENSSPAATVSAASYRPVISPDSLAVIFGTQLSGNLVHASLDAQGQLPTELDGTKVEINGRLAL
jgi:hypothetical protein